MGDPRRLKTKYETPRKQWDTDRISTESKLVSEYGLKNIRELWVALAELKKVRREARRLLSVGDEGAEESKKVLGKLTRLGIGTNIDTLDKILTLDVRDFLERRLQTRVLKRGLARTTNQARQLIAHGFVAVNGRKVTSPSYMVPVELEPTLAYFKPISIEVAREQKAQAKKPAKEAAQEAPAPAEGGQKEEAQEAKE
ncbi:MAG: 30S ribosomal protein S4 [Candidatus Micrarchaeia archaeon]